jgi:hypothetical protein
MKHFAYDAVHFLDQVGRSFSRTKVYTESPCSKPMARRPEEYKGRVIFDTKDHTSFIV